MNKELKNILDKALSTFSTEEYLAELIHAKKQYTDLTGRIDDEDVDYENRMSFFNSWYLFNYKADGKKTQVEKFADNERLDPELKRALRNVSFSVFLHAGKSISKKTVIKDILNDVKYTLPKDHDEISVIKNDVFLARVITYKDEVNMLADVCLLPNDSISVLKKKSKELRKSKSEDDKKYSFLMETESLKNRYKSFTHVPAEKFFNYKTV